MTGIWTKNLNPALIVIKCQKIGFLFILLKSSNQKFLDFLHDDRRQYSASFE